MEKNQRQISNPKIEDSLVKIESSVSELSCNCDGVSNSIVATTKELAQLEEEMRHLMEDVGKDCHPISSCSPTFNEIAKQEPTDKKVSLDFDTVIPCVAGGIAILVDFIIVKIPKTTKIVCRSETVLKEGSPMTAILRKIGFKSNGKTSNWIKVLEKYFGVVYDKSVLKGEPGFSPKTHRLYSLAHDPSPAGFLWAVKDSISGTMSYISKDGVLKIIPAAHVDIWRILAMPIIWIGHILSDMFTKSGIPIPYGCLLRTLQFGSIGEKGRTIGQVVEYMYIEGFDLRHMVTMCVENAVIELILRIYHILTKPRIDEFARLRSDIIADKELQLRRLQKMRLQGYAIATCGNVAKLAVYRWNPLALNITIWTEFLRTAIAEFDRKHNSTQSVLDLINLRKEINNNFEKIDDQLKNI